jgi:hypothetical protein
MKARSSLHSFPIRLFLLCVSFVALFSVFSSTNAGIPNEYVANYEIKTDWEKILDLFVQIDADSKIGQQTPQTKFANLHTSFVTVFPKLPQEYSFKVTYSQCLSLSQSMTSTTSLDYTSKLNMFMTNCYKPLSDIFKKVTTKYAITAQAKINPSSGPAPLTVTFDARESKDPSNDTIPSKNYFWYYKDAAGIDKTIGVGEVISATFDQA